jgi:hypothetical protein
MKMNIELPVNKHKCIAMHKQRSKQIKEKQKGNPKIAAMFEETSFIVDYISSTC